MTNAFDTRGPSLLGKEFRVHTQGSTAKAFGTGPTIPALAPKEMHFFARARAPLKPGQVSMDQWLANPSDDRVTVPGPVRQFGGRREKTSRRPAE